MKSFRLITAAGVAALIVAAIVLDHAIVVDAISSQQPKYAVTWIQNLTIITTDGVALHANAFVPLVNQSQDRYGSSSSSSSLLFPLVVFPNSWGCREDEYELRASMLASLGFVALEYETRGWYRSGGYIDTAGPLDISDASTVIDFALSYASQWHINVTSIGFAGISYGAGISLLTAAADSRVRAVVAMSGWNNLTDLLYGGHTPNVVVFTDLMASAEANGKPNPDLVTIEEALLLHDNISCIYSFGNNRSVQNVLRTLNEHRPAIMLSSNYLDLLFRPQYVSQDFFPHYEGPKMLLMNQGGHAQPEAAAVHNASFHSYIFDHMFRWLECYLQGNTSNGIQQEDLYHMQLGTSILDAQRLTSNVDPSLLNPTQWYLSGPPSSQNAVFGTMTQTPPPPLSNTTMTTESLWFDKAPLLTNGATQNSQMGLGEPFVVDIASANRSTTLLYTSGSLTHSIQRFCGTAKVNVTVSTNSKTGFQLFGFLYVIHPSTLTLWEYLTDFYVTQWHSTPDTEYLVESRFHTICRDIPQGAQLGFGLVMYSPIFLPATASNSTFVNVTFNGPVLTIPMIHF